MDPLDDLIPRTRNGGGCAGCLLAVVFWGVVLYAASLVLL